MSIIDWHQFAKINGLSYEEFGKELINSTMAFMEAEMVRNNSDEMIVTSYPLRLTCKKLKDEH